MRPIYSGAILLNSDYDGPSARARMAEGIADGISFGRPFIANPDLVHRLAICAPLSPGDESTFYSGGASRLRRLSDLRRGAGRLGPVFLPKLEQRQRRPRRAAALVALRRVGAGDRLRLVLDGQDAVADGEARRASAPSGRARFPPTTISK